MSTSASAGHPRSRGYELDANEFGFLSDSSAHSDDIPVLRQKMKDDGYLFLRGFFKRDDVLEVRQVITDSATPRSMWAD